MTATFDAAQQRHTEAVAELAPLLVAMALATIAEELPGADTLETEGVKNEDWNSTLRIQRVLDANAGVLYDVGVGHGDPEVETTIDEVGLDCLDLLLDVTGEEYLGRQSLRRADP
ncbi:MAG: hypothetical protein KDB10_12575 [Acidimicrobiales bacterium]|nr:hypothetical protein [Acidimicrobiales bacterium]